MSREYAPARGGRRGLGRRGILSLAITVTSNFAIMALAANDLPFAVAVPVAIVGSVVAGVVVVSLGLLMDAIYANLARPGRGGRRGPGRRLACCWLRCGAARVPVAWRLVAGGG